jgi:hypothetical protein
MNVGYNFVTKEAVEEGKYEKFEKVMSIINFLRLLKRGIVSEKLSVVGFEKLLSSCENYNELSKVIKNLLRENSDKLLQKSPIIQFIIDGDLQKNEKYFILVEDKKFSLNLIFGNRLDFIDVDWFYSPFNI